MSSLAKRPDVFALPGDPVATGLVASLARPASNITGVSSQGTDLATKRLQILRETVPGLRRLAIMGNVDNPASVLDMAKVHAAARTHGLDAAIFEIRGAEDLVPTFEALKGRMDALYIPPDALINTQRIRINTLALGARLPTMYGAGQAFLTSSGAPLIMLTRFCAGRSRVTSRSSNRPSAARGRNDSAEESSQRIYSGSTPPSNFEIGSSGRESRQCYWPSSPKFSSAAGTSPVARQGATGRVLRLALASTG
jgi:ABC transporter substrate binding protein